MKTSTAKATVLVPDRPQGSGPVERYVGRIQVEDASGCRFDMHEYSGRRGLRRVRRYVLDTGELVRRLNENTFAINRTGETLIVTCETTASDTGDIPE